VLVKSSAFAQLLMMRPQAKNRFLTSNTTLTSSASLHLPALLRTSVQRSMMNGRALLNNLPNQSQITLLLFLRLTRSGLLSQLPPLMTFSTMRAPSLAQLSDLLSQYWRLKVLLKTWFAHTTRPPKNQLPPRVPRVVIWSGKFHCFAKMLLLPETATSTESLLTPTRV